MSAVPAARLVVVHHDDRETVYEDVRYYPWPDGVTVWAADGTELANHDDVLYTRTGA